MPYVADRVQETTTTSGTGAVTLAGAKTGYRTFATAFGSTSRVVTYGIVDGTAWEVGEGVFNGTTNLTRARVRASSNSNSLITLSGGSADVFCTATGEMLDNANIGSILAQVNGWAMP